MNIPSMIHKNFEVCVMFNSPFPRWWGRWIIWCWVIIWKYSDTRNSYIIEQIYVHKKLTPICSKLIFRLLVKLAIKSTFKFNNRFLKQMHGCTMGGPLSVTFSEIYMVKMENDVVIPSKPIFYCRFVDDIYSRHK